MPYQGIFNNNRDTDPNIHHRLDLTFSVAAGYDDDVLPSLTGGIDPTSKPFNGYNNTYTGTAQYAWQGRKMQAGLTATSALRQYTEFNDYTMTHAVGAGFAMQFARRTTLFVNQSANYSPPYLFGLFPDVNPVTPGDIIAGGPNYVLDDTESLSYESIVTVEHGLTRRGTISVSGDYRFTDFLDNSRGRPDVNSSGLRSHYTYAFGRNTAFTAGYHYRSGELGFGTTAVSSEQGLDFGMEYSPKAVADEAGNAQFLRGLVDDGSSQRSGRGHCRRPTVGGFGGSLVELSVQQNVDVARGVPPGCGVRGGAQLSSVRRWRHDDAHRRYGPSRPLLVGGGVFEWPGPPTGHESGLDDLHRRCSPLVRHRPAH